MHVILCVSAFTEEFSSLQSAEYTTAEYLHVYHNPGKNMSMNKLLSTKQTH